MQQIQCYKDESAGYSQRLIDFIERGTLWENTLEMQQAITLEDAGWKVKVYWGNQTSENGDDIGIGLFAGQDISAGTVIRTCTIGKNLIMFDANTNLPDLTNLKTAKYLQNYAFNLECNTKTDANTDALFLMVPGCSINHSQNGSNVEGYCSEDAIHDFVTRDVKKREPLFCDYRLFGNAPKWFVGKLRESIGEEKNAFQDFNQFV